MVGKPSFKDWDKLMLFVRKASKSQDRRIIKVIEYDFSDIFLDSRFDFYKEFNKIPSSTAVRIILKEKNTNNRRLDIRFKGVFFEDTLHLEHLNFDGYLRFDDCTFSGRLDFRYASLRRLKFTNCNFEELIEADVVKISGDIEFTKCNIESGLALRAANVGGRIVFNGCDIGEISKKTGNDFTPGFSIDASMIRAESGISIRQIDEIRTTLHGSLDLSSAVVGGNIEFRGATITPCLGDMAVDLSNSELKGFLFVREETEFNGKLNIFAANIGLLSISDGSTIRRGRDFLEPAIDGEEVTIATSLTLGDGVSIEGINLSAASIGGIFQYGGRADESGASGTSQGSQGINVSGQLNLTHARIGRLSIDFSAWGKGCRNNRLEPFFNGCVYDDIVNINGRDSVHETELSAWIRTVKDADLFTRSIEIERQKIGRLRDLFKLNTGSHHHPQVYHQLISVLRSKGREKDAISIEKLNYRSAIFSKYNNRNILFAIFIAFRIIFGWVTGYGRSIKWLLSIAAIYIVTMSAVYNNYYDCGEFLPSNPLVFNHKAAPEGIIKPEESDFLKLYAFRNYWVDENTLTKNYYPKMEYPSFNPLLYSLDVFLPLVDLSQEKSWSPITRASVFPFVWFLVVAQIILGWVFSGLIIAHVSRILGNRPN